jgi:aspartate/methionine/tyrosine aminotransferase
LIVGAGLWLIADEAYEDFVFDGATHRSPTGPNVINIFTFSKSYGLAGWRVGYVLFPPELKGTHTTSHIPPHTPPHTLTA